MNQGEAFYIVAFPIGGRCHAHKVLTDEVKQGLLNIKATQKIQTKLTYKYLWRKYYDK
jgi:hypothetical protein